jgi:hypothetical protein
MVLSSGWSQLIMDMVRSGLLYEDESKLDFSGMFPRLQRLVHKSSSRGMHKPKSYRCTEQGRAILTERGTHDDPAAQELFWNQVRYIYIMLCFTIYFRWKLKRL